MRKRRSVAEEDSEELLLILSDRLAALSTDDVNERAVVFMEVLKCSREEAEFFLDSARGDVAKALDLCVEHRLTANESTSKLPRRFDGDILVSIRGLSKEWASFVSSSGSVYFAHMERGSHQTQAPASLHEELLVEAQQSILTKASHEEPLAAMQTLARISIDEATFYLESSGYVVQDAISLFLQHNPSAKRREILIEGLPEGWLACLATSGSVYFEHAESGYTQTDVPMGFAEFASTISTSRSNHHKRVSGGDGGVRKHVGGWGGGGRKSAGDGMVSSDEEHSGSETQPSEMGNDNDEDVKGDKDNMGEEDEEEEERGEGGEGEGGQDGMR